MALKGKVFDEEACESTGPKSCRVKYTARLAALVAQNSCPLCLDMTHQETLADQAEVQLDSGNGDLYCAGSVPLP